MTELPPHIAREDEPLADLAERDLDGPDLRDALPLPEMIRLVQALDGDDLAYIALWTRFVSSIGLRVLPWTDDDGTPGVAYSFPVDAQTRHRNRYWHLLSEDLKRIDGRFDRLIAVTRGRRVTA